ncbi:restriction endonuclease subunit S [Vibrio parahaemolyticus]|uniref:restriction endonuclease subunit S n=1 Tax=Vibrio parahaemolyticus TaxID=670 RepID=UPI002361B015|nr:restriction endonuclease subunit S [Vibrio parahaemolyticus]ELA9338005.1 restriction endonuclease subunit S [Vibrio parahaemolyticus]HCG5065677.1 restriction endonuclease subunit S [Vibrio parahaemolyticus]HCG8056748.1 restriction endonuclease subunit S [Vibrio parahaemolyticus]
MVNDWPQVKLGSLYKEPSRNGLTKPKKVRGEGYKFINMGEIFAFDRMLNIPCDRAPLTAKEISTSLMKDNDLLFARQSLVLSGAGKCSIFLGDDEDVAFESHLIRVRLDEVLINPEYAYYYFFSPQGRALMSTIVEQGAGQAGIRGSDLEQLVIPLPPMDYQNYVVSSLRVIDDKITLNRQINQTLEQMAQTMFKSWFVDFDPVIDNALDAGHPIPDQLQHRAEARKAVRESESESFKPLPDDVRQLFPDAFEESELGWVPKGWEMKSVSGALTVNPKVKLSKGQSAHFVDMKALPTSGYSIEEVTHKAFSGGAKFEQNDVLLARITPCLQNGKTGFVDFLGADEVGFGSTEFIVLRGNKDVHHTYIACLARHEKFRQHAMQSMVGSSGRQRVQNSCFDDYFIAVPTDDVMKRFAQMTQPSFDKFKANTAESIALAELRDTLLPKLISGELRLDDVEAAVEQETVSA